MTRLARLAAGALALALLSGCAGRPPVAAWEKGHLAKPGMSLEGASLDERFLQHVYTSRETASGGSAVGGGGCGCN